MFSVKTSKTTCFTILLLFMSALNPIFGISEPISDAHLKQGNIYFTRAMYKEAISEFEKAVEKNPLDVYANTNLAYTYFITGQNEKAFDMWENVTKISPENGISLGFLSETFQEKFVDIGGIFAFFYPVYCVTQECRNFVTEINEKRLSADPNFDNSIRIYEKGVIEDSNNVIAQHLLAMSYYEKGWKDIAVYHLKKSLDIAPLNFSAMYSLAATYDDSESIRLLQNALSVNPDYLKARYLLSYRLVNSLLNTGSRDNLKTKSNYVEAEFKDILSSGKASEGVYESLAYLYYMLSLENTAGKTTYDLHNLRKMLDNLERAFDSRLEKFKKWNLPAKYMLVFPMTVDLKIMLNLKKADNDSKAKGGEALLEKVRLIVNEKEKEGKKGLFVDMMNASLDLADAQYYNAKQILSKILKEYPQFITVYHKTLGDIAFEQADYESAIQYYKQAANDDPDSIMLPARIGQCYLKLNKEKEVLPYFINAYEGKGKGSSSDYVVDDVMYSIDTVLKKYNVIPYVKLSGLVTNDGKGITVGSIDNESFCAILNAAKYECSSVYLGRVKKANSNILDTLNKNKVIVSGVKHLKNFSTMAHYVENGGRALFLIAPYPAFDVIRSVNLFGISLSSMTLVGGRVMAYNYYDRWIRVIPDSSHPIFKGIDEFYAGHSVEIIPGDASVLARVGDVPVIVEKQFGKGKIIVAGIDTDFQDAVWKKKDEKIVRSRLKLLLNMVAYLAKD